MSSCMHSRFEHPRTETLHIEDVLVFSWEFLSSNPRSMQSGSTCHAAQTSVYYQRAKPVSDLAGEKINANMHETSG